VKEEYRGERCDLMIALHARRSFSSVQRFRELHPDAPLLVALTGTDLYGDPASNRQTLQSMELASRLIVLQPLALRALPKHLRARARVIYQSVEVPAELPARKRDVFEVCVIGHLREVKDPFRAALAARGLPEPSRIRVIHVGAALSGEMETAARAEEKRNPRYRWMGDLRRSQALRVLARCRIHVLSSTMEGGANVLGEAIALGVPTLASRIDGSVGILGAQYPGYFPVGDTGALRRLLWRAESDAAFLARLQNWCKRLRPLFQPSRERKCWQQLLRELHRGSRTS